MHKPVVLMPGHSHMAALDTAQRQRQLGGLPLQSIHFMQLRRPEFRMNPQADPESIDAWSSGVRRLFAEHPDALVISCIAGNAHAVLGLVEHPQRFDFVLDEAPDLPLDEQRDVLPCAVVAALLERQMLMGTRAMRALRALVRGPVLHLAAPPPVGSAAHILSHPDAFAAGLAEHGLTPAVIRLKLWRLQSALTRRLCAELGFAVVDVPPQAVDADGFLAAPAWHTDPAHGNAWYGEQVLQQIDHLAARYPDGVCA